MSVKNFVSKKDAGNSNAMTGTDRHYTSKLFESTSGVLLIFVLSYLENEGRD